VDLTLGHLRGLSLFWPEFWSQRDKFRLHLNASAWRDVLARIHGTTGAIEPRDPQPQPNRAHAPRALAKLKAIFPALKDAQIV
ncbi:hypothetical protein, partial [Listeria monocytogenes]